jgi:hypothetical protein
MAEITETTVVSNNTGCQAIHLATWTIIHKSWRYIMSDYTMDLNSTDALSTSIETLRNARSTASGKKEILIT